MKPTVVSRSTEPRAAGGSEEVKGGGVGRGELPRQNSKNAGKSMGIVDVSPPLSVNATGQSERESYGFLYFSVMGHVDVSAPLSLNATSM